MSLCSSVYPLHSSLFRRFSPLSFQHDINPQRCFTQSGLLDNKYASYTAPSLHQLLSAIHLPHLPLAGPPRPYTPCGVPERHKAGCVYCLSMSHCNQPSPTSRHKQDAHVWPSLRRWPTNLANALEEDGNLPFFLLPDLIKSEICWSYADISSVIGWIMHMSQTKGNLSTSLTKD